MKNILTKYAIKLIIPLLMVSPLLKAYLDFNSQINVDISLNKYIPNQTTTIFAAYSQDGMIPDYVISYLKLLKEISPNIIYITDNPIKKKEISKLKPFVTHLIASRHEEYDWGSYKRGYNWLKQNGYLENNNNFSHPLLIFANDSTIPTTTSFAPILSDMKLKNTDFYGITANQDGTYHIQSYFLIITPQMYNHPNFAKYLNNVIKQKDGLTVAYRYEVPFTQYFTNLGFSHSTYIDYKLLSYLPLNDKNCYPLTMLTKYNAPLLKMRTFTNRLNVQESRRLVFNWLRKNQPETYKDLIKHLKAINSPYLKENR